MSSMPFEIDPDIRRAATPPARFYRDEGWLDLARERIFARSWQLVGDAEDVKAPGALLPVTFLPGLVAEPLLLARDGDDRLRCLSNVCTHRGNLLVEGAAVAQVIRCRYHGRRFSLDGRFLSMPEFEEAEAFPSPEDDLPQAELACWRNLLFAALEPALPFAGWIEPLERRIGWLPLTDCRFDPARSRDYLVRANWALYCDNYLEGFHIPFVHAGLARALDYAAYRVELFTAASLQLGVAAGGEEVFELPPDHPDHGLDVAAYYFFLFPNLMVNVYPWGLSINVVQPLAVDRTRVRFLTYPWRTAGPGPDGAGAALDRVEREDEGIVEAVQHGIGSRFYDRGRYSPRREQAVHHFHRLLARALRTADGGA